MIKRLNESTGNRSFDRVAKLCDRFGYVLDEDSYIEVRKSGEKYLSIYIYPDGFNKYAPTINVPIRAAERKELDNIKFTVQTSSFGSLDKNEYESFYKAVENAYKLVQILCDYDFSGFPEVVDEWH